MHKLKPARRKRLIHALKSEFTASSTGMTGLMPFLPENADEMESALVMYPTHKARRD